MCVGDCAWGWVAKCGRGVRVKLAMRGMRRGLLLNHPSHASGFGHHAWDFGKGLQSHPDRIRSTYTPQLLHIDNSRRWSCSGASETPPHTTLAAATAPRTALPPRSITRTMVSSLLLLRSVRASSNGGSTLRTLLQPQLRQQGPPPALAMAGGVRRSMATTLTQRPPRLPGLLLGGRQGRLRGFSTSGSGGGGGSGAGRAQSKASIPVPPSIASLHTDSF